MRKNDGEVLLHWPLERHIITAGWTYNDGTSHGALDFRCTWGGTTLQPVYAAEEGTVTTVQNWDGETKTGMQSYGNMILLRHSDYEGGSLCTRYAHLAKIPVTSGQWVREGEIIGYTGSTGNSTAAHLHFEVIYKNKRCNPLCWLDDDFVCAEEKIVFHLGNYTSVTRENTGDLYRLGPCSEGDARLFDALAKVLNLAFEKEAG